MLDRGEFQNSLGNIDRQVRDAFKVCIDPNSGGHKPQIARQRLMKRQNIDRFFFDLDFHLINAIVIGNDFFGEINVQIFE